MLRGAGSSKETSDKSMKTILFLNNMLFTLCVHYSVSQNEQIIFEKTGSTKVTLDFFFVFNENAVIIGHRVIVLFIAITKFMT